jgi:hypothetical protein
MPTIRGEIGAFSAMTRRRWSVSGWRFFRSVENQYVEQVSRVESDCKHEKLLPKMCTRESY